MAPYVPKIRSTYTATSHSTLDGLRQRECLAYIQTSVLSAAPLPAFSPKPPPSFLLPPASVLPVIPIPSFGMILSLCGRCPTSLGVTECGSFCGVHRGPETAVRGHFLPTDAIDAPIGRVDFATGRRHSLALPVPLVRPRSLHPTNQQQVFFAYACGAQVQGDSALYTHKKIPGPSG